MSLALEWQSAEAHPQDHVADENTRLPRDVRPHNCVGIGETNTGVPNSGVLAYVPCTRFRLYIL